MVGKFFHTLHSSNGEDSRVVCYVNSNGLPSKFESHSVDFLVEFHIISKQGLEALNFPAECIGQATSGILGKGLFSDDCNLGCTICLPCLECCCGSCHSASHDDNSHGHVGGRLG